ncbi:MAG: hypothetical protein K8W52_26815, partial [Deltaproteobacteria bacterium]|nr:hypothetical protein [Deltaproteobacteria bacterium]
MRGLTTLVLAALALRAAPARADGLVARGSEYATAVERSHTVAIDLRDRVARFEVTRVLANPGDRVTALELAIDLPTAAVARGLRLRAGDRWIDGALLDADLAADRYTELTTGGTQRAHGPAMLRWDNGGLALSIYPVPARSAQTIAYTLEAPACYARGRWITDYPRAADDLARVAITVRGPRGAGRVLTAAQVAAELGQPVGEACADDVALADDPGRRYAVVDAPAIAPFDVDRPDAIDGARATLDRVRVGTTMIATVRLELAPTLAVVPRGLRVVFVVDGSKSEGATGIAAQLAWIHAYLAHTPDAEVEIVVYRRWAERLFGRWRRGADAARALAR